MRIQTARIRAIEKKAEATFKRDPDFLIVFEDEHGAYTETSTGRPVPKAELDAMRPEDFLLVLTIDPLDAPPVLELEDAGIVKVAPPLSEEEWEMKAAEEQARAFENEGKEYL